MATVDKLIVKIEADLSDLKRKLGQATNDTKNATKRMEKSFGDVRKKIGGLGSAIFSLKGALVGLGVGAGIKSLIDVGSEVESLQIRFETLFGSAKEGQKAFEVMANFASQVPFSLQEIQAGAGSLLAVAGDAEELGRLMKMTGTIAAATGLDFRTTSEQIQRSLSAGIGAADLFRDRGVTALLGFKAGVQTSVEDSREALEKFAQDNDGITDRLAGTFQGTLSMLGDAVFTFQRTVNDAGFFSALTQHFQNLKNSVDSNQEEIKEFAKNLSNVLVGAMKGFVTAIKAVVDNAELLKNVFITFVAIKLGAVIGTIISAFVGLKVALTGTTAMQIAFNNAVRMNPYVAAASVVAGGIALIVTNFDNLTRALGLNSEELEENTRQLSEQEQELKEIAEIQKEVNRLKLEGVIQAAPDVTGMGGIEEAMKQAKERITAEEKANKAIKDLIQAEKDNQAQLTLSAFELAKYNLEKEHNIKFSTQQLAILEREMAQTKAITEEQKKFNEAIADMQQIDIDQAEIDFARIERMRPFLDMLKEQAEIEDVLFTMEKEKLELEKEMQKTMQDLGLRTNEYTEEQLRLKEALSMGIITLDEYKRAMLEIKQRQFEATEEGKIFTDGLLATTEALSTSIADQIMGMGDGFKSFKESLKGIVRDMIAQFIKLQIQAMITKAAMSFVGGPSMGFSLGGFGGKAGGGFVQSNKPVVVGERGPELFVPNTAGNIMTNNRSRQAVAGGNTVNQTLHFDVGVSQTVRNEVLALMPTIKKQSIDAMIDAKERGGRVADVFK